ncbi:MAG TPA: EAL domain-containing protein, partial [Gammaproteobacteria bacterium]|nr:EAL domain-containing protein [Gammaproteobacteria bacterium]
QLQQGDLVASVRRALAAADLPGDYLELEVTESSLLGGGEEIIYTMNALRALGLTLAVDDFGTGYSSLAYLKRLPIDRLKVDKGFVQDIPRDGDDVAITRAVIHMGRALGLTVLAEGVETEEQWRFLQAEGAHEGQGFLWHKPAPDPDFGAL